MWTLPIAIILNVALSTPAAHSQSHFAPFGLESIGRGDSVLIIWYYPGYNQITEVTTEGTPDTYFAASAQQTGAELGFDFGLSGRIAVVAVGFKIWDTDPFPASSGNQNSPFRAAIYDVGFDPNAANLAWSDSSLNPASPVDRDEWQLYSVDRLLEARESLRLAFGWNHATPLAPLPAAVATVGFPETYLGVIQGGSTNWSRLGDILPVMRIDYCVADTGAEQTVVGTPPDSIWMFALTDPDDPLSGVRLAVTNGECHVSLRRDLVEGRWLSVAAWQDGVLSPKSAALYVDLATGIEDWPIPDDFADGLEQNYPNPFNLATTISSTTRATVYIYDILGRQVRALESSLPLSDGRYYFHWDGRSSGGSVVASGVYFYRQSNSAGVRRMLLLK